MGANDFLYCGLLRGTNLTQLSLILSGLLYEPGGHWWLIEEISDKAN